MFSQRDGFEKSPDSLFNQIRTFKLAGVDTNLLLQSKIEDVYLKYSYDHLTKGDSPLKDTENLDSLNLEFPQSVFYRLLRGDITIEKNKTVKSDAIAYENYLEAYDIATKKNDIVLRCEALKRILKYHFKAKEDVEAFYSYATIYRNLAYDLHEELYAEYFFLGSSIGIIYDLDRIDLNPLPDALIALNISEENSQFYWAGRISQLIGVYYDIIVHDRKKASDYYYIALNSYKKIPHYYAQKNRHDLSFNLGILENENKNYSQALDYFNKINFNQIPKRDAQDKVLMYDGMFKSYLHLAKIDSALLFLDKKTSLQDSLKLMTRAKDVKDINTKYQTAEKEKQILKEQQRATLNRNWLIAACVVLLLGGGMAFLIQQNTTKKRKLAEQETQLEQQKVETLLKEQELVSIDAMIAGQEKERQKVANELHDDLGSLMATVKLHFDNVKVDQKDPALKNAQKLLDEAYQKIRGMAHAKNSGVMANKGLLSAVKKMAKTINATNALTVTVEDFGLAERMENSLELTIFRIIQELTANIIKHSGAKKANIQFTQHEANLNIIVEDDGKGFDMSSVKRAANGMGLGTIEKRIEHLEGTFTVDSVLGKGTSILIDIPI